MLSILFDDLNRQVDDSQSVNTYVSNVKHCNREKWAIINICWQWKTREGLKNEFWRRRKTTSQLVSSGISTATYSPPGLQSVVCGVTAWRKAVVWLGVLQLTRKKSWSELTSRLIGWYVTDVEDAFDDVITFEHALAWAKIGPKKFEVLSCFCDFWGHMHDNV